MSHFGITKVTVKSRKYYLKKLSIPYLVLVVFCFSFFAFYDKLTGLVFSEHKIDIFKEDLHDVAFYFRNFDKELTKNILKIDDIMKSYQAGENIFTTKSEEIEEVRIYVQQNKDYLQKLGFANYEYLFNFLGDLWENKNEIFQLLGQDQEFNYLVLLQNTNEKRPNGGFFGSFGFISFQSGHLKEFEIIDAYYPDYIAPKTYLTAPEWTKSFLPEKRIGFIASNKFGFTHMDGVNIKTLFEKMVNENYEIRRVKQKLSPHQYEKLLHKYIKGVIFLRTDFFEEIIPDFHEKVRERQFLNASIDLIKGEVTKNKKEMYIEEVSNYFNANKGTIAKNFIENFETIKAKELFHVYFSNISTELEQFLQENNLNSSYSTGKIYARDTNNSYNKVDGFINKNMQIHDANGKVIKDTHNDILDISDLPKGQTYHLKVYYMLSVPQYYYDFVAGLEKKYNIQITNRERGIMALIPAKYTPTAHPRWRESKSTIYFPQNFKIIDARGDNFAQERFQAPFANGLFYQMRIVENHTTKYINITFEVE